MDQSCEICKLLTSPAHILLMTLSWQVSISNNQAYRGRAYITLRTHKGTHGELTAREWQELYGIIAKLENAYMKAFSAGPISWGSFMDHAYREEKPKPHIHWHVFPRYKKPQQIDHVFLTTHCMATFSTIKGNVS
jgi:diadenosine tetraphosphate (Ap4A) HIT family hydrolase